MFVKERFSLSNEVKQNLQSRIPNFGYNGFGEMLFYRTYSRIRKDGGQETWADVVTRVIEGTFSIRKEHYNRNYIPWVEHEWQEYAEKMAISMFEMKWMPPGRGLWAMGTDFVYERGSMPLYNCAYIDIHDGDMPATYSWIMDSLMNGVGVGFGPIRSDNLRLHPIAGRKSFNYIIGDSREDWCSSVEYLVQCFLDPTYRIPAFDYSEIRPKGAPIKGFGGIASGPEPLKELHENIIKVCEFYIEGRIDSVLLKSDIANMIGCCVVAGNVRRSAEIACGMMGDMSFMDMKDYTKYPYRAAHGWMSNNSVLLTKAEDFEQMGKIAERVRINGEPGYINMMNVPYGRIGKNDGLRSDKATGFNPCLPGWVNVMTPTGAKTLAETNIGDKILGPSGWTTVVDKWSSGVKDVFAYETVQGTFYATPNHRVMENGVKVEVQHAKHIDTLIGQTTVNGVTTPSTVNVFGPAVIENVTPHSTEEVFDITVDNDSHTFWCDGFHVSNCGEIALESGETCNVAETCPTMCDDVHEWYDACEYATFYTSTVSLLPTHQQRTNSVVARNRRIGVSIVDVTGWVAEEGMSKVIAYLRNGYKTVTETNKWANGEAGVPEAIRKTTMKPGGTVPKLLGKQASMSYPNFHHTLMRVRVQQDSPIFQVLIDANVPHEPDVASKNTEVFEFPVLQGPAKMSSEVSIWEQAMLLCMLQREWADNAVSNTLNFRPKWPMVTKYDNAHCRQTSEGVEVLTETDRFFYEFDDNRRIDNEMIFGVPCVTVREFDPRHEEDSIEEVLSMIAPLTKSVSLLPASAKGVYAQMPQEGISEEEYERRLKDIKPIDWTKFRNSDGQDEMYCVGDKCELPAK
jgi:hypothetical protein